MVALAQGKKTKRLVECIQWVGRNTDDVIRFLGIRSFNLSDTVLSFIDSNEEPRVVMKDQIIVRYGSGVLVFLNEDRFDELYEWRH